MAITMEIYALGQLAWIGDYMITLSHEVHWYLDVD